MSPISIIFHRVHLGRAETNGEYRTDRLYERHLEHDGLDHQLSVPDLAGLPINFLVHRKSTNTVTVRLQHDNKQKRQQIFALYYPQICTISFKVRQEVTAGLPDQKPREQWDAFDPMLISEGVFGAANICRSYTSHSFHNTLYHHDISNTFPRFSIGFTLRFYIYFSFLKMVPIFSTSQYLGPIQISLGRMVFDILKFFLIYALVLFAFGCGMNQLLWYYADMDRQKCYSLTNPNLPSPSEEHSCEIWRRFAK